MIEYIKVTGAGIKNTKGLPDLETIDELYDFFYSLEGQLADIESQLDAFHTDGIWPNNTEWTKTSDWLEATYTARRVKLWQQTIVRATLNKLEKTEKLDRRISDLEGKVSKLTKELKAEKASRIKVDENRRQQIINAENKHKANASNFNSQIKVIYRLLYDANLLPESLDALKKIIESNLDEWTVYLIPTKKGDN